MILKNKAFKITFIILSIIVVLAILMCITLNLSIVKYHYALNLIDDGKYQEAYEILYPLGDYKDNIEIMKSFTHQYTLRVSTDSTGEKDEWTYDYYENGNLKSESYYSYDDSKQEYEYIYDSKNRLIKEVNVSTYTSGEKYTTTTLYEYDENGCRTKEYDEKMHEFYWEYFYDENCNLLKKVYCNGDVGYEFTYDYNGNLIEEKFYNYASDDKNDYKQYIYTYDEKGNLIKIIDKSAYSNDRSIREAVYDDKGNPIKIISYTEYADDETSDTKDIVEIEYDSNGNIVKTSNNIDDSIDDIYTVRKMIQYRFGAEEFFGIPDDTWFFTIPNSTTVNTYDNNGNEIQSVTTHISGKKEITDYTYNKDGLLTKVVITNPDGTKRIAEYKYDAYGNKLEYKLTENGDVIHKTEYIGYVGIYKKQ